MWTSPCCSVDRRKSATISPPMMKLVILSALVSSVCCTQVGPSSKQAPTHALHPPSPVQNNGNSRPATASRRSLTPAADPLDTHLDRIFANLDEKNGKEDSSVWDRIKRNFIDQDRNEDQLTRRTFWKSEGTLLKPKWLAKVYEAAIVGGKAIVKVINKEYPTHYLIHRVDVALDIVDRVPYFLDRLIPILDIADSLPHYLGFLTEIGSQLRPVYKLIPRAERLLVQVERVDINGLVNNGNQLLHRVSQLPLERMVELLFNLSAEFKSITDLVKQAQALIPSLLPLFLGRGQSSSSSSSSSSSGSKTTTTTESSIVFFPPLDDEDEENAPAGGSSKEKDSSKPQRPSMMMLVQFPPLDPTSTTARPSATTARPSGGGLASIDPAFLAALKPEVIANINPNILSVLTPELVAAVNAEYLNALEPKVLRNLQPELLAKVDPKLLSSIPPSLLNALPEDLIRDFKPEFLEGLDPALFANLDPALLEGLDADTIRAFLMPDSTRRVFAVYPVAGGSRAESRSRWIG